MSHCRRCGAKIHWAITDKGRKMPVDPAATHPKPNLWLWKTSSGAMRVSADEAIGRAHTTTLTTAHFATCPFASQERKPR